jgi:oxepin-CoA hydrolase/3-oxo-5,6-dehydrosuberyl-CoA semialdehyde dehydrogenase
MPDILDRKHIFKTLSGLREDTAPLFGKMTAQHMVEHLTLTMTFCNGRTPQVLMIEERLSQTIKHYTVNTDKEMGKGFKAPMLGDDPPPLINPDLPSAIKQLKKEMEDFDAFFKKAPHAKPVSPVLGILDHQEWIIFHNKHFTHHFKQFGLI